MARKKSADLERTKQDLLEVGLSLFEQKGFNATGIQEIATLTGIPKGSFYNYFSSKEDFGVAVIRYYTDINMERWSNSLDTATEKEDSYKALRMAFLAITEEYRCAKIKKGCLLGNLAAEISEASEECRLALQQSVNEYKTILAEHLLVGQQMGKVRSDLPAQCLADLVWDCWQGSLLRMKIEKSVEPVNNNLELLFHHMLLPPA
ncbi:MAG: transcriptional regulator, TetR family [Pelosinus sp.]|jgi:TetR/AcrR family transcriptional repressor of nem operon|nr:transcriptional regulator, TetR family [Pelosinus sp.]